MTTERDRTSSFAELIDEIMEHGDKESVGRMLHIPRQHIAEMAANVRRDPFEAVQVWTETLRRNGNARANDLFIALGRSLGFVTYLESEKSADDAQFSQVLREFSDLMSARAEAERDGKITPAERLQIVKEANELMEGLASYRDAQLMKHADAERFRKAI